ncbi:hypothetical protein C8Q79DRAFT_884404, partial [Trametes meyenii]
MWLKDYLNLGPERPMWAYLVDDLLARTVPKDSYPREKQLRTNTFLQLWEPKARSLPDELKAMLRIARKYGVRQEGLAFTRAQMRAMPMWAHAQVDEAGLKRLTVKSRTMNCMVNNHGLRTVGDFEKLAGLRAALSHSEKRGCACKECERLIVEERCASPRRCAKRAEEILDLLPPRWDPRREHPEDYEEESNTAEREAAPEGFEVFDRRIMVQGDLGATFRIFTENRVPDKEILDMRVQNDGGDEVAAVDGSCVNNGDANARAGAGVFFEGAPWKCAAIRLPSEMTQTNQTGEAVAGIAA